MVYLSINYAIYSPDNTVIHFITGYLKNSRCTFGPLRPCAII